MAEKPASEHGQGSATQLRVLLAGDTHGNLSHVRSLIDVAGREGCDRIVQVGDFGYWPHMEPFHERVDGLASAAGIEFYWLDGNHENFDALEAAVDFDATYPQPMGESLWYLPRGSTWTWDDCRFMALGGAYSIDKQWRTEGISWWREEEILYAEAMHAIEGGKAVAMLTHDLPWGVELAWDRKLQFPEATPNRKMVREVVDEVRPKWLFHGHMHFRQTSLLALPGGHMVRVESLNCDSPTNEHGQPAPNDHAWIIRDTSSLSSITRDLDTSGAFYKGGTGSLVIPNKS